MSRYEEFDFKKVKVVSIQNRKSKFNVNQLGQPTDSGSYFRAFWNNLPSVLASKDLHELVDLIVRAVRLDKPVLVMMGAHVIKVGLNAIIVDWLKSGFINGIAFNGAGAIHDIEMTYFGKTSEDVETFIKDGRFGMAKETADIFKTSGKLGYREGLGFGEVLGRKIVEEKPKFFKLSVLGEAYRLGIPVTIHVALGTDIVHQHPSADGATIGELSLRDFRIWTQLVSQIADGGVVLLFGSAVILPEVFLKALTVARNVVGKIQNFTTAVFDMYRHYRPQVNVVERPTLDGGRGFYFIGHHEIMIPLLCAAVKDKIKQ